MTESTSVKKHIRGDMTQGNIMKHLILFMLPMLLGNVFQQLYNTADSIIVGQYVGSRALAAVGVGFPIIFLLISLFNGIAMGGSVMVSQYFGAKDFEQLKKTIRTSLTLTVLFGVLIGAVGMVASKPILRLLNTPSDVIDMANAYMVIIFLGVPGSLLYNIISGLLRGLGDAKWPLVFLVVASLLNIVLDLLFVIAFGWGIAGAAWATIFSQAVSAVLAFIRLQKGEHYVRLTRSDIKVDKDIFKHMVRLGLPSGLQDMAFSLGMMVIQTFVNSFGYSVMAAGNAVMRVDGFAVMPMFSISAAATTFIGQNVGAGNSDRVKRGALTSIGLIVGIGGLLAILVVSFGSALMSLFTDDPQVLETGAIILRILGPFIWVMGLNILMGGILRGAGDAVFPAIMSLISMVLVRIPLAYFLAYRANDYRGLYYAMIAGFGAGTILNTIRFLSGKWKGKAVTRDKNRDPRFSTDSESSIPDDTDPADHPYGVDKAIHEDPAPAEI
jgi:putative MATE family efflux protein